MKLVLGAHRLQFCGLPTSGHPLLPTTLGQAAGTAARLKAPPKRPQGSVLRHGLTPKSR